MFLTLVSRLFAHIHVLTFLWTQTLTFIRSCYTVRNLIKRKLSLMKKQCRDFYDLGILQFVYGHVLLIRTILLIRDVGGTLLRIIIIFVFFTWTLEQCPEFRVPKSDLNALDRERLLLMLIKIVVYLVP